jgi:hypothetical protein
MALHRLNPANGTSRNFDLTTEYPRWRLARDRRGSNLQSLQPIVAEFELDEADLESLATLLPAPPPRGTICKAARSYDNSFEVWLECNLENILHATAIEISVADEDVTELLKCDSLESVQTRAKERSKELKTLKTAEPLRAKAMIACADALGNYGYLCGTSKLDQESLDAVTARLPQFFYFSSYDILPGECDLSDLAVKVSDNSELTNGERTGNCPPRPCRCSAE